MRIKYLLFILLILSLSKITNAATNYDDFVSLIYEYAHNQNRHAIEQLRTRGYSVNVSDSQGNTALCEAIKQRDERAYKMLIQLGADTNHPCVKKLTTQNIKADSSSWNLSPAAYVGAAVLVGGGVALAAGGGGGGGGSSSDSGNSNSSSSSNGSNNNGSNNNGSNNNGSNNDSGDNENSDIDNLPNDDTEADEDENNDQDIPHSVNASFFENNEYYGGGFLSQIGASNAYARYYSADNNGNLFSSLDVVGVGIVDSGVYGAHAAFAGKDIKGVNYDYGPCLNGDTTNCWYWDSDAKRAKLEVDGQVYLSSLSEDEYNEWAAIYDADYDWDLAKDSETSYYPNSDKSDAHGTHVAGIIAANKDGDNMHGVAFDNAEIIAARWDLMSPIYNPVKDVIDMGAKVVNFSLGYDATKFMNASTIKAFKNQSFLSSYLDIIPYQVSHNVVFVFAAGNEWYEQPGILNGIPLLDEYKTQLDGLFITVVAVDKNNQLADFSNACGVAQGYCLAAPGVVILSAINKDGYYGKMDGTSMAAPVVTGSVAFLMGAYPYMKPQEIVHLLFETATDLGEPGVDPVYGNGLVNLDAATEPQGELMIATTENVNGAALVARSTTMTVPALFKSSMLKKIPQKITVFDKYKRPYSMSINSMVRATHSGERNFKNDLYAFSRYQPKRTVKAGNNLTFSYAQAALSSSPTGLGTMEVHFSGNDDYVTGFYYTENTLYNTNQYFEKSLSNPFMAMNSAYGVYNRYNMSDNWNFTMEFATGENGLYDGSDEANDREFDNRVYGFNSEVSWQATDTLAFKMMSGILYEDSALLGLNGTGGFDVDDSNTYYAGLALTWSPFKNIFLSGAWYQGWTNGGAMASDLIQTGQLVSDSFALDAHWQYNGNDIVGFQLSSPLRIYKGKARFNLPVGRDDYSDTVYRQQYTAGLKPDAREYKFSLYHDRDINEDMSFKIQADVRLNPDHQKDAETDYRIMFGFNWTFN